MLGPAAAQLVGWGMELLVEGLLVAEQPVMLEDRAGQAAERKGRTAALCLMVRLPVCLMVRSPVCPIASQPRNHGCLLQERTHVEWRPDGRVSHQMSPQTLSSRDRFLTPLLPIDSSVVYAVSRLFLAVRRRG